MVVALAIGGPLQGGQDYCQWLLYIPTWDILRTRSGPGAYRGPENRLQGEIMRMGSSLLAGALVLTGALCNSTITQAQETVKVKIEGTELDRQELLKKLNKHGADHRMRFELADEGFAYRIDFGTGQRQNGALAAMGAGAINYSLAQVSVFDAKGTELFRFDRANRYTDAGATNAAAKEIIKRMLKLQSLKASER